MVWIVRDRRWQENSQEEGVLPEKHALADGRATANGRGKLGRRQGKGKSTVRSRGMRAAKSGVLPTAKADRQECLCY